MRSSSIRAHPLSVGSILRSTSSGRLGTSISSTTLTSMPVAGTTVMICPDHLGQGPSSLITNSSAPDPKCPGLEGLPDTHPQGHRHLDDAQSEDPSPAPGVPSLHRWNELDAIIQSVALKPLVILGRHFKRSCRVTRVITRICHHRRSPSPPAGPRDQTF